jgi:hypothetical protein
MDRSSVNRESLHFRPVVSRLQANVKNQATDRADQTASKYLKRFKPAKTPEWQA